MRPSSILAGLTVMALSCGGNASDTVTPEVVATITVTSESPVINVHEQRTLAAQFHDAAGRSLIGVSNVTWTSSDPATIRVEGPAIVQGLKAGGPVTITAEQGGITGSVTLNVVPTIRMQPVTALLAVGGTMAFTVNHVDFLGATIGPVAASGWTSSNTNVATVDANGVVTGAAPGDVTISATVLGAQQSASLEVGAPTSFDGTWTGTPFPSPGLGFGSVATVVVTFGAVRSFDLALNWNFLPTPGATITCQGHAATSGRYPVTANAFTFPSSTGVTISGSFADDHSGTLTWGGGMTVAASSFACPGNYVPLGAVGVGGRTLALTK
jgi:hypothetical protein